TTDSVLRRLSTHPAQPADSLRLEAGMNRAVWNLRVPDARRFEGMILWAGNLAGPVVVPDTYKVRLRVGGWSSTQAFELKRDPRVSTTQADLERQYAFLIRIRDRVSEANDAVRRIRAMKEQIDGVAGRARRSGDAGRTVAAAADSLKARLSAVEEQIYQVRNRSSQDPLNYPIRLNNKLAALNGVVASADAAPTDQSLQLFDELSAALQVQLDRLKAIVDTEVPALNQRVKALDLPAVPTP
ncbi:MAG: glycosyl hydrolase, partial [Gemmatimonadales bacterium]